MAALKTLMDSDLTGLLQAGDHAAFAEIYQRYWKKLLHFATQKTGDMMDAENIVQDVFVSLWNRRAELRITTALENYLLVSVKYRVIKLQARQRSERLTDTAPDILDDSTRQYLDFEELQERLSELIGKLPEKAALIFRLHQEQGLSHKAIAEEMDMSEKAVNAQLVRTRKSLRTALNSMLHSILL